MQARSAQSFFVYGTLMHPPVFEAVTERSAGTMAKARLEGFRRSSLTGVIFPGIVPTEGAFTDGLIVVVDAEAMALLDAFEGTWYDRKSVTVEAGDGQKIAAEVYVLSERVRHLATGEPWELEIFLAADLHSFLND